LSGLPRRRGADKTAHRWTWNRKELESMKKGIYPDANSLHQ
jgi:hypothetical protein